MREKHNGQYWVFKNSFGDLVCLFICLFACLVSTQFQSKATGGGGVRGLNALGHAARVTGPGLGSAMTRHLFTEERSAREHSCNWSLVN